MSSLPSVVCCLGRTLLNLAAPICSSHDYISIGFDDNKLMLIYILVYMIFQYVFYTHICLTVQKEDILMKT